MVPAHKPHFEGRAQAKLRAEMEKSNSVEQSFVVMER